MSKSNKKRTSEKLQRKTIKRNEFKSHGLGWEIFGIMLITIAIIMIIGSLPYHQYATGTAGASVNYEIAKVTQITAESLNDSDHQKGLMVGSQEMLVRMLTGKHRGETVPATNALSTYNSVVMKTGRCVVVVFDELDTGEFQVRVYNYFRTPYIILMAVLFFTALTVIGGKKGVMSGFGLAYTFACIILIFLPLILRGYSPIFSAILVAVMVTSATIIFLNGMTRKSLCAILGTISGVVLSGVLLFIFGGLMHLSGYSTDEAESLLLIGNTTGLQVKDLLFSGILIASLGAVMDVAVSIVSAIHEIHANIPDIHTGALIHSAMNVGKDMIGTMSNTLILAFVGTSLNSMILLYAYSVQANQIMNMNTVAIEITQALAGSLGVILTVPITAIITANMIVGKTAR